MQELKLGRGVTVTHAPTSGQFKSTKVPIFGDVVKGLIAEADHEKFAAFASKRPRLADVLGKKELTEKDKEEIKAAYSVFKQENTIQKAILKQTVAELSTVLGVSKGKTREYLEVYKPEQVRALVAVAESEELNAKDVIAIDLTLIMDGSYSGRRRETTSISLAHARLCEVICGEYGAYRKRDILAKQDQNMDTLWDRLLKEFGGDEEKAAEVLTFA